MNIINITDQHSRYLALRNKAKRYQALYRCNCDSLGLPTRRGLQYAFLTDYFMWLASRELLKIVNSSNANGNSGNSGNVVPLLLANAQDKRQRKSSAMRQLNFWARQMRNSYEALRCCQ